MAIAVSVAVFGVAVAIAVEEVRLGWHGQHPSVELGGQREPVEADANGQVSYSIAIVISDEKGKVFFEQKPYNSFAHTYFGGNLLPAAANVHVPLDTKASAMRSQVGFHLMALSPPTQPNE